MVVAVLVLVAVPTLVWMLGPGATWVLEHIDHATVFKEDKDRAAALAAIRGNVLAVATGLAALLAVFYTARNADTARRTFQLGERGHDTDRFSKAVEQLGSAQAPVRLGGLYALEQLAQNNPRLRQTIVDVICAYLRMPWTPPREEDRHEKIRAAQRAARTGTSGRTEARAGRDPDEERQVRFTAQRLLIDHLRWQKRRWWQLPTAANALFWPGIRLDLTGVTLVDFDFERCRVDRAVFRGATFIGDSWFNEVTFTGNALFEGATFAGNAPFGGATFIGEALFEGATFAGNALFGNVTFFGNAGFGGATFTRGVWFRRTSFIAGAAFGGATFLGNAVFKGTRGTRIDLAGARVMHPDNGHVWPPGWHVSTGPTGAVLKPDKRTDDGGE
ncbi:pentapeptide repeat-containing protein [Nonomuraea sp. SYSU D8015]|uniref:pentapeptide repeat-containing protein n=1 Tax=Nonomuraea sp. SYSU D8015 TaxID=2593644 RepID=UPI0016605B5C|nr:pentapeptide repeat-containing protein [Nonomuraea sp. SYSU D8015]